MSETPTPDAPESPESSNDSSVPEPDNESAAVETSKPSRGLRFNVAFGSSVDLIKLGLLAIILAWGMRGIIGSFAQKGEANRESYQVFHKELEVDQEEAAEEDRLAKAEKQTEQLKIVNDFRSQAELVKAANHTIDEAIEDWLDAIGEAANTANDTFDTCAEDAREPLKEAESEWEDAKRKYRKKMDEANSLDYRSYQRAETQARENRERARGKWDKAQENFTDATDECREVQAQWCSDIDKDAVSSAKDTIKEQTKALVDLLDEDTVDRYWVVDVDEDPDREHDPDDYDDDDWRKECIDWGSATDIRVERPSRVVSNNAIFGKAGWDSSNRSVTLPNCGGFAAGAEQGSLRSGGTCIVLQTEDGEDIVESFQDLEWDITMLEGKIRETYGTVELEKHTVRHEAEQDELEGQAAIAYWNQWNKWLTPISMLLYIAGVILLVLGNIGVLASGVASSGLRSFAIATSAVLVYLLLQDAIGLHVPDQGGGSSLSTIQATGTR